jgi:hypothetical protein
MNYAQNVMNFMAHLIFYLLSVFLAVLLMFGIKHYWGLL